MTLTDTQTIRVAAVQYGAGPDVDENLATTLKMIDQAAECGPDLVVLPEFVNHCSWYEDGDHCARVSVSLDGPFVNAIADRAKTHGCFIVANCSVVREDNTCTGTSLLFDPDKGVVSTADKQVLIGHENDFLERASEPSPIADTSIGRLGLYACMDGVLNETPRGLALRGAQILCNSLNSFAFDESSLHIPVRAAENKVFVVAANKTGPLIPEFLVEPVSKEINIPGHFLSGAGESQIVAPDGTVLAKAPIVGEAVVYADINPADADDKTRPDGTDIFRSRRPDLYGPIGQAPAETFEGSGAQSVLAAIYQPKSSGEEAIAECLDVLATTRDQGCELLTLPELFWKTTGTTSDPAADADLSTTWVESATAALAGGTLYVATSIVEACETGWHHMGILIGPEGVVLRQPQLHPCHRHSPWMTPGNRLEVVSLPMGRVALLVGDDNLYPESYRLAVLQGAEVVAAPCTIQETWEVETGLLERAAENRVCVVAASRPSAAGASLLLTLWSDYTLMTPWATRLFDGNISAPIVQRAGRTPGLFSTVIHPANAANKVLSHRTHVVDGRAWSLAAPLLSAHG